MVEHTLPKDVYLRKEDSVQSVLIKKGIHIYFVIDFTKSV